MAMMRRGPLAQYSAEWVLRQASATNATGSVEFHCSAPVTLYLRGGQVCHGVEGVPVTGFVTGTEDGEHADEAEARAHTAALVGRAEQATDGWYYFDPLGHHDDAGPWQWDAAALLREARTPAPAAKPVAAPAAGPAAARSVAAPPAAAPVAAAPIEAAAVEAAPVEAAAAAVAATDPPTAPERPVRLIAPSGSGSVTLSTESWRVVCALASPSGTSELRTVLGWTPDRLDAALTELATAGLVTAPPIPAAPPQPTAPEPQAAAPPAPAPTPAPTPAPAPATARSVPPTVAPQPGARAVAAVERRSALRRLISNLKPA